MSAWLLLVLTAACAVLTLDAFRLHAPLKEPPLRFWPKNWRVGMEHLPLAEQERLYRALRPSTLGAGVLAWIFLVMTTLLALLTIGAFME